MGWAESYGAAEPVLAETWLIREKGIDVGAGRARAAWTQRNSIKIPFFQKKREEKNPHVYKLSS